MTRTTNTMIRSICRDPSAVYKKGGDAFFGQKHMKRQELLTYLRACEKQQIHPDFSGKDLTGTDFSGLHGRDGIRTLTSTHRQACGVAFGQPDRPVGLPSGSPE